MSITSPRLVGWLMAAWLCSCHPSEKNPPSREAVLASQPFAPLTDSLRQFPTQAGLYIRRAALLTEQNFHEIATADYQKAWQLQPGESTALDYISNLFVLGHEAAATRLLQQCIQAYPGNREFVRRLSETYVQRGELRKALKQYDLLLENDSSNFEAWYEKGLLHTQLKDTAQAIASFEKAYQLQPLQLYGISLANLYAATKNAKALQVCDELIGSDSLPGTNDALFIKGMYLSNTHQYEQALHQYETCIRNDWRFVEAYIEKGIILFNEQNIDEALNTFATASKVSARHAAAYYWIGRCYEKIGKTDEAQESYERTLLLDPDYPGLDEALKRLK